MFKVGLTTLFKVTPFHGTYFPVLVSYPLASSDGFLAKTPESVTVDLVQSNWPVEEKAIGTMPNCAVVIDAMCLIHSSLRSRLLKTFMQFAACILKLQKWVFALMLSELI